MPHHPLEVWVTFIWQRLRDSIEKILDGGDERLVLQDLTKVVSLAFICLIQHGPVEAEGNENEGG